ncbi:MULTISPECIES: phosphoribosylanthranilate isomerase [unclassified Bacillus (in: firmicutes)]|uniref:phosphoribosylanthranilate isomerase n=1 Tax=unclassified Bacillus (in: firmicutes) TaxID=185979 RepID=UPI0008F323E2|nr:MULTISPECIES: phosphoribosylanthranilate isomerase [unclassified Bacillus (in: firmicutes)]SFA91610.1 phosphoribosylanthranilate isomerase [Bacillus sp. UNCCL13]SFQ85612.1 phosphoribosylanthranilate isomerase [Bacillus sp. cl95]
MRIKICGIIDSKTAIHSANLGADALGFVFAKSKRMINGEKAQEIIKRLPADIMKIGVFVNEKIDVMERIASQAGLTHFQLHGDENPDVCKTLSLPVIKAFSIKEESDFDRMREYSCECFLLDSAVGPYRGGNGTTFDWSLIRKRGLDNKKIILAGGLNAANVKKGIHEVAPWMVDVSSGVETKGVKDFFKIGQFIREARGGS